MACVTDSSALKPELVAAGDAGAQSVAWASAAFENPESPVLHLTYKDVGEVNRALQAFKELELDGDRVDKTSFPLPTLQEQLERAAIDIHDGQGLAIIRGLDPARFSPEDSVIVYLGIASHIADKRGMQDRRGNMLVHVTDNKQWQTPYDLRYDIHTNHSLEWHNDMGTDILALHVRSCAEKGGDSYVASGRAVYEDLVKNHPDVAELLVEPAWPIQVNGNAQRYILAPLVQHHDGKLMISLDPSRLGRHPAAGTTAADRKRRYRDPAAMGPALCPDLTPAQHRALAIVSETATRHRRRLAARPGDMIFLNNWALLHARDAYVDTSNRGRHLVRLWLRSSALGWDVPATLRTPWEAAFGVGGKAEDVFARTRTGWRRITDRRYPIMPAPEYKPAKYSGGTAAFLLESSEDEDYGEDDADDATDDIPDDVLAQVVDQVKKL